jgi:choline dehydrogenase
MFEQLDPSLVLNSFSFKGPFSRLGFNGHSVAYTNSLSQNDEIWPDLEIIFFGGNGQAQDKIMNDQFLVQVLLIRPKSTGELILSSKDPNRSPSIDPKYLKDPSDAEKLIDGT